MNCIAVDDEILALDLISAYCSKIQFINLLGIFDNSVASLEFLLKNRIDLLFLDIQMAGLSGIQLIKALDYKPAIILTTAFDTDTVESYKLDVSDCLLKPISFAEFEKSVKKIYDRFMIDRAKQS